MVLVPFGSFPDGTIISVVDGLQLSSVDIGRFMKLVMEYHKPLATALDKGPDSLVDRKRPCFNFIQGCLGNNDIVKTGSIFQHIHSMKHDVGVHNHIVHFTACELLGCA